MLIAMVLQLYISTFHTLVVDLNARNFVENFIEMESDSWICAFFMFVLELLFRGLIWLEDF